MVLVTMPFAGFRQPSLALGLLKASLAALPVEVRIVDATLDFAALIEPEAYDAIATWRAEDLLGDWIFSEQAAGSERAADPADYLRDVLAGGLPEHRVPFFGKPPLTDELRTQIDGARAATGRFLDACHDEIAAADPLLVGFTTMVHQQTASLALARRLKATLPGAFVVFGGAACRGPMGAELLRSFPFVDAVAGGDGERVLPALVERLLGGRSTDGVPGLLVDDSIDGPDVGGPVGGPDVGESADGPAPAEAMPADLDRLPTPDFSDYFDRLEHSPLRELMQPRLPFEASRGCWWGERRRCVFCGQASAHLAYRAKTPQRTLRELLELGLRHPGLEFVFTDEIVPRSFVDAVAPLLPERLPDLRVLYYETRPDLTRDQAQTLARAGIRRLEVGIESLSTPVLRLMRKGTTALQGVQFLKWARELGITVVWNVIWGLPGESDEHDAAMADLVPLLTHLQPPHTVGEVRLDRFSPLFEERAERGLTGVRPFPAYGYVYRLPPASIERLAYSFAFDREGAERDAASSGGQTVLAALADRIDEWKRAFPKALLWYADDGRRLLLSDSRPGFDAEEITVLDGDHRALYLACDRSQTAGTLARKLGAATGRSLRADDVHEALTPLVEQGFMLREAQRYLSLALRLPTG